jgi:DNA-directed RNA polymerase specialized sigma24 family protein
MASDDGGGLHDFVAGRYAKLRRSAFLMCGDWALAGESTERSLARLVAESRRTPVDDPEAFAYSHLMAALQRHRSGRRRRRPAAATGNAATGKAATGKAATAEAATADAAPPDVLGALRTLAPRCRAVLVLRRWDGFDVDETADMLGLAGERVDAYEAAGLAALDYLLAEREPAR